MKIASTVITSAAALLLITAPAFAQGAGGTGSGSTGTGGTHRNAGHEPGNPRPPRHWHARQPRRRNSDDSVRRRQLPKWRDGEPEHAGRHDPVDAGHVRAGPVPARESGEAVHRGADE